MFNFENDWDALSKAILEAYYTSDRGSSSKYATSIMQLFVLYELDMSDGVSFVKELSRFVNQPELFDDLSKSVNYITGNL
jgi:hypothetical protein